jgi:hypothetical protein
MKPAINLWATVLAKFTPNLFRGSVSTAETNHQCATSNQPYFKSFTLKNIAKSLI